MARKSKDEPKVNYSAEIKKLKAEGPQRLYLLWGPEEYLREQFVASIKKLCLPDAAEDDFSYKRIDGPDLDYNELRDAVDAMPFMTERTMVELRGVNINKLSEPEIFLDILKDIPDFCTLVFVQSADFVFDGRLKAVKGMHSIAYEMCFKEQEKGDLINWIQRRFAAQNKSIELSAAQQLMFISGSYMNKLIPEIEKIAAYAKGEQVTMADVEAVANHIPDADVFQMTEFIANKKHDDAMRILGELLGDKNNEPIAILGLIGKQMRRLYAARLAIDNNLGKKYVVEVCKLQYDYIADKLLRAARSFTPKQLMRAVELCAEMDYRMKSENQTETKELLRELMLRIASGESRA